MCKLYTLQSARKPRRSVYHVNGRLDRRRRFLYIIGVQNRKEGGTGAVEFWRKDARNDEAARVSVQEVADRLGVSRQNVNQRLNADKFTLDDMEKYAAAIGCGIEIEITEPPEGGADPHINK